MWLKNFLLCFYTCLPTWPFKTKHVARKVLLATAAALYPSTTFPALQLTSLTIITGASMLVYGLFQPYRQQRWNWSEALLTDWRALSAENLQSL